jgi:hypothetical protein
LSEDNLLLVGCGILKKELAYLVEKNAWPMDLFMLASGLHSDFHKLQRGLEGALKKNPDRQAIVFYGCCHPLMDQMLEQAHTFRTEGQNCVEMVLGKELFTQELLNGAFFLFEDWANNWSHVAMITFGAHPDIMQEIFRGDRNYILALRTPVSGDFTVKAEEMASQVGLPLRWMDVGLDNLEVVLQAAVTRKLAERDE